MEIDKLTWIDEYNDLILYFAMKIRQVNTGNSVEKAVDEGT